MSKKNRPILDIPLTGIERRYDVISWFIVMVISLIAIWAYSTLPDEIPIHWDFKGEVDNYGPKYWILVIPFISIVFHFGLIKLCDFPHTFNYLVEITPENAKVEYVKARKLMRILNLWCQVIFGVITVAMIRGALTGLGSLGRWFIPLVLLTSFIPLVYAIWDKKRSE